MPSSGYRPEQEIRFAVVLYGGVSLAIYMNGIAQELLRMVRGSADLPDGEALTSTETVYRHLAASLRRHGPPEPVEDDAPVRSRFMVDIISGTSAGGINGVALAKALALNCRSLDDLRQVWVERADIDTLLNDSNSNWRAYPPHPEGKTTSLLNSERMYGLILETLGAMNDDKKRSVDAAPLADKLDLFVTATDLVGLSAPIQLTGHRIDERIHKTVFHFEYDAPDPNAPPETDEFTAHYDPMLAFAARCTSSFPVAFEPMRFDRILGQLRKKGYGMTDREAAEAYKQFFPGYLARKPKLDDLPFQNRPFADGGYLDNRPFSHAIRLFPYRSSEHPAKRKLLFVDPFPEIHEPASDDPDSDIDFVTNATLAAKTLPRYEVIRDDILAVTAFNRRLDRLDALQKRHERDRAELAFTEMPSPADFGAADLKKMAQEVKDGGYGYGEFYPLYHHLRVYDTSDFIARLVTRLARFEVASDQYHYLRQLVRAWREEHYSAYRERSKATENAFLDSFDAEYRLRRLNHVRSIIDEALGGSPTEDIASQLHRIRASVENQLARLRNATRRLASRTRSPLNTHGFVEALRKELAKSKHYESVMNLTDRDTRFVAAVKLYRNPDIRPHVDALMNEIATGLKFEFDRNRAAMKDVLDRDDIAFPEEVDKIRVAHRCFHWHDVLSLPFLEGTGVCEHSNVQIFRISPADSGLVDDPAKLAGIALGAFGGFLERDWREHDILWGRLDGAERIITALMPEPDNALLCQEYINEAHDIILVEEFTASGPYGGTRVFHWLAHKLRERNVTDRSVEELIGHGDKLLDQFPMVKNLVNASDYRSFLKMHYNKPPGPPPEKVADWSSRTMKILGRMIDDLPEAFAAATGLRARVASICRSTGVLLATLLYFALPGSLGQKVIAHGLSLIALAGLVLIGAGLVAGIQGVAVLGFATLLVCLGLWIALRTFGHWLRGRAQVREPALVLLVLLIFALIVLGAVKLWELILSWTATADIGP